MRGRAGSAGLPRTRPAESRPTGSRSRTAVWSASLRIAVVGPLPPGTGSTGAHTLRLAQQLADAGHDVTLVSWSAEPTEAFTDRTGPAPFFRTVRSLGRHRPDTWVRTGRRLRAYDTVVLVHAGAALLPMGLAVLRSAGIGAGLGAVADAVVDAGVGAGEPGPPVPRGVLVCDDLGPARAGTAAGALVTATLRAVDGVVAHRPDTAEHAARLGASRVYLVPEPDTGWARSDRDMEETADLPASWAAYLGAVEALAAPLVPATDATDGVDLEGEDGPDGTVSGGRRPSGSTALRALTSRTRAADAAARSFVAARRRVDLGRADLPDWVLPTDVLDDAWRADEARDEARALGLPRSRDAVAAWAALGALAAVLRVADDGRHAAVVVDESGTGSPLTRWLRACGFAPVDLGLTTQDAGYDVLEVDAASLDVVARVHPGGCDAADVDVAVAQAAWALRPGGLLVLTLPLGRTGDEDALGPADVRALVARAHDHGFVLVGDLDGDVGRVMRSAARVAEGTAPRVAGAAYGLVRLTLRRR